MHLKYLPVVYLFIDEEPEYYNFTTVAYEILGWAA
jgi:hypothetical protein